MEENAKVISEVCLALLSQDWVAGAYILKTQAPMGVVAKPSLPKANLKYRRNGAVDRESAIKREYTPYQSTSLFIADGFIDRYSGERLVFPGVLRLLSDIFPHEFPYHPNWKSGECHHWYWELFPTVDHVKPVTRGGLDSPDNWVTTSMINNLLKSNTELDDLGWQLYPRGDFSEWDGLMSWFVQFAEKNQKSVLRSSQLKVWFNAATKALGT